MNIFFVVVLPHEVQGVRNSTVREMDFRYFEFNCTNPNDPAVSDGVVWYHPTNRILFTNTTLRLNHSFQLEDSGDYRCEITSLVDNSTLSENFTITVEYVPSRSRCVTNTLTCHWP